MWGCVGGAAVEVLWSFRGPRAVITDRSSERCTHIHSKHIPARVLDSTSVPPLSPIKIFQARTPRAQLGSVWVGSLICIAAFSADDAVELGIDAPQAKRREQLARVSASDSEGAGLSELHPLGLGYLMQPESFP